MKKIVTDLFLFFLLSLLAACSVVGGIFKAGMGVGIFLVIAIIVFVLWLVMRGRK